MPPTPNGMARTAKARAATRQAFAERAARNPQKLARAIATVRAAQDAGLVGDDLEPIDEQVVA